MRPLISIAGILALVLPACTTPAPPPPAAATPPPHPDPAVQAAIDREIARRQARVYEALQHIEQGDAYLNANDPEQALGEYQQGLNLTR